MNTNKYTNIIKKCLNNPRLIMLYIRRYLINHGHIILKDDKKYLEWSYWLYTGEKLDLENPKTFNQKLQWLKINDRKSEYCKFVDKSQVKKIVGQAIGDNYIIPTIGEWATFKDINFDSLPNQFVLKCTHDSGGVYIIKDKKQMQIKTIETMINKSLSRNYYWGGREWPYKNIKPRIIAEEYMSDESGVELKDYKFFVFNGRVHYIQVDYDRFSDHHRNFYNRNWEYVPFTTMYPTNPQRRIEKPYCLSEMITVSERISAMCGTPAFVRVDLYLTENGLFFGEVTFYHGSGFERFYPKEYDKKLGDLIHIDV